TLNLYNTQGQLLLDQEITATYTLDTSGLSKGIYLLKATDEQGRVYSQKIIKE
ncbi:MAG TPA: T9SS type A sorting domain-containing protein, partial [Flavobacteriales bacterium]|nr:T9SS type A sorting domain-containing protein [Flavobacteriales bacterium]